MSVVPATAGSARSLSEERGICATSPRSSHGRRRSGQLEPLLWTDPLLWMAKPEKGMNCWKEKGKTTQTAWKH